MGKSVVHVEVSADTKKASAAIKKLQRDAGKATGGGMLGQAGKALQGAGIPGGGMLGNVGGLAKLGIAGAAVGGAVAYLKAVDEFIDRGQAASKEAANMNVALTQLAKNFGGTGAGVKEVTRELQLMSANGVNSMDSLQSAMKVLTVAYKGNVVQAGEMLKGLDDIAAGTGTNIDTWATLTAKVAESGLEYRDLNKLARQGIPIWDAMASALNTTADEAKAMAKEGKLGVEDWNNAVKELGNTYKGVSAAMSAQTLEGAKGTYEAMRSMQNQAAADSRNREVIDGLNKLSSELEKQLDDPVRQKELEALGTLAGNLDVFGTEVKQVIEDLPGKIAIGVGNSLYNLGAFLTGNASIDEERLRSYAQESAWMPGFDETGKSVAELEGLLKETVEARRRLGGKDLSGFDAETARIVQENYKRLEEQAQTLAEALERAKKAESERQAEEAAEASREAARKEGAEAAAEFRKMMISEAKSSGDPQKLLDAYFGGKEGYTGKLDDYLKNIPILEELIKGGTATKNDLETYKALLEVQKASVAQAKAQADSEKQLNDARADAARIAVSERDAARKNAEEAVNAVTNARRQLQAAEVASANRQMELERQGIFGGAALKQKLTGMSNYNDWMKLYDQAAAEGMSKSEWRRMYSKAKKMSADELAASGLFKRDSEMSTEGIEEQKAAEELRRAEEYRSDTQQKLSEANQKIADLADALGKSTAEVEQMARGMDQWQKACVAAGVVKVRGTALAG